MSAHLQRMTRSESIIGACDTLRAGGIVVHPTETCYGLACDLTNAEAVAALFRLKQRPLDRPVSALFPSVEAAQRYVVWHAEAQQLARERLPGPLTLVLPVREDAPVIVSVPPEGASGESGATLGIRVSSHPVAAALAAAYGQPISTTSANRHGLPNPYSIDEIRAQFSPEELERVFLIDGGTLPRHAPSMVVDLTVESAPRVLRSNEAGDSAPTDRA